MKEEDRGGTAYFKHAIVDRPGRRSPLVDTRSYIRDQQMDSKSK